MEIKTRWKVSGTIACHLFTATFQILQSLERSSHEFISLL